MTESLVRLVAEQKQRLESKLAIAYEVQDLLFPHKFTELGSLEVYGVCRPARSVSGYYYDFVPLGANRLVVAVGDISGKRNFRCFVDGYYACIRSCLFAGARNGIDDGDFRN